MKTKEEVVKRVEEVIFENNLPKNKSVEIVAYWDGDIEVDFVELGTAGLQKGSISWEQFDECFDVNDFADEVYNNL